MTVRQFLTHHGLAAYADAFEAQAVAMSDLADLTDDDLRALVGMSSFPDRKRFKVAVASIAHGGPRQTTAPPASSGSPASGVSPLSMISSYDLYECIGEGGMGSVYRGRHRAPAMAQRQGGDVAVKVVHAHLLSKGDIAERFRREAEALALLDHPNIVKVHDVVEESGRTAIVMEWVPGRALSAVIGKETGPIPWDRAQALVVPLLSAVAHAHSLGIVHRDLKPENIMVTPSGEIKLLDFGIARLGESRGRTKTGTGMGTVDYMAPEQFLDAKRVDLRADVYALGLTLYEMLAGRLPWDAADSEFEVMSRKKEGRIPPPTHFYPWIPPWIVLGVMAAIRPNPSERTQSVVALEASLRGEGVPAQRVVVESVEQAASATSDFGRVRVAIERRDGRVILWLAAVGILALVGFVSVVCGALWLGRGESAPRRDFVSPTLGVMKWIPRGTFTMGSPISEAGRSSEETQHSVRLTQGYWLMEHEVTQDEWLAVMGRNPSYFPACGHRCPVEQVSWVDSVTFAQRASARDGVTYALPTEAQWEYAARGGQDAVYAGSNQARLVGWIDDNSGGVTHPVCGLARNGYGLCDMTGNVWEWTSDWYGAYTGNSTDPTGASDGDARIFRGGSWHFPAVYARLALRRSLNPNNRGGFLGLRLVRTIP